MSRCCPSRRPACDATRAAVLGLDVLLVAAWAVVAARTAHGSVIRGHLFV